MREARDHHHQRQVKVRRLTSVPEAVALSHNLASRAAAVVVDGDVEDVENDVDDARHPAVSSAEACYDQSHGLEPRSESLRGNGTIGLQDTGSRSEDTRRRKGVAREARKLGWLGSGRCSALEAAALVGKGSAKGWGWSCWFGKVRPKTSQKVWDPSRRSDFQAVIRGGALKFRQQSRSCRCRMSSSLHRAKSPVSTSSLDQ